jgi:xanthine dehydrogenase small subunit
MFLCRSKKMTKFILNNQTIETELPIGTTVLDFVRYNQNLKGTKIGCREGDCGACTVLVGELKGENVKYRTMTSCLMPIGNAQGKHIVTVEGINKENGELTSVQQAMVDESGTQCGFCTVGFVMSMTNFCIDGSPKTKESAISAIDGNICRCTGYKSIERACERLSDGETARRSDEEIVPTYFKEIKNKLESLLPKQSQIANLKTRGNGLCRSNARFI